MLTKLFLVFIIIFFNQNFIQAKTKIAYLGILEGSDSRVSLELLKGIDFYFWTEKDTSKKYEIVKFKLTGSGKIEEINQKIKEIISKKIKFVIGLPSSEDAIIFGKLAKDYDVILLTPFATSDLLVDYTNVITFAATSKVQANALFDLLKKNNNKNKKIMFIDTYRSKSGSEVGFHLKKLCEESGMSTELIEAPGVLNSSTFINKINGSKVNFIYFAGGGEYDLNLIKDIDSNVPNNKFLYIGSDNFGSKPVIEKIFKDRYTSFENRFFYTTHWDSNLKKELEFVLNFKKWRSDQDPTSGVRKTFLVMKFLDNFLEKNNDKISNNNFLNDMKNQNSIKNEIIIMTVSKNGAMPIEE